MRVLWFAVAFSFLTPLALAAQSVRRTSPPPIPNVSAEEIFSRMQHSALPTDVSVDFRTGLMLMQWGFRKGFHISSDNLAAKEYLDKILLGMLVNADIREFKPLDFRLFLVKTPPSAGEPNAYSYPGGFVIIEDMFLAEATAEAELAFVEAHEVAHSVLRHDAKWTAFLQFPEIAPLIVYRDKVGACPKDDQECKAVLDFFEALEMKVYQLKEEEADRWALDVAIKAGYDADVLFRFLDRSSSHYPNRITRLREWAENRHIRLAGGASYLYTTPDEFAKIRRAYQRRYPRKPR